MGFATGCETAQGGIGPLRMRRRVPHAGGRKALTPRYFQNIRNLVDSVGFQGQLSKIAGWIECQESLG